eukprot:7523397-Ditylum_brightwellii.AAC.3
MFTTGNTGNYPLKEWTSMTRQCKHSPANINCACFRPLWRQCAEEILPEETRQELREPPPARPLTTCVQSLKNVVWETQARQPRVA